MKRKKFIQTSAVAGLGTAILPKLAFSDIVSNKRIKIGVIGTGLRGQWVLWLAAKYPEIDIPAICDIDDDMIESALKILKDAQKPEPKVYKKGDEDFRNMVTNDCLLYTSEPTRPLYISYAVFCLKKKNI